MALIVDSVSKEFPTRGEPLRVLRDVSFSLTPGERMAIVGPSGSGKSTLLYILGALDTPTSGSVTLHEENPFAMSATELAAFRNRTLGFVFQDHHLLPQLSVLDNVRLGALATGTVSADQTRRADELIERVGLSDRRDHVPGELSGGEKQRVAIARALLMRPQLLLADEPTGNLDQTTAMRITELLLEIQTAEETDGAPPMLIVVTHSQELAARMGRVLVMQDGRVQEQTGLAS